MELDDVSGYTSKNDIFTASWRASPPPPPPLPASFVLSNVSQGPVGLLGRSKTTGALSQWRSNKNRMWVDIDTDKQELDPRQAGGASNGQEMMRRASAVGPDVSNDIGSAESDRASLPPLPLSPLKLNRTKSFFGTSVKYHHDSPFTPTTAFSYYTSGGDGGSPTSPALTHSTGTSSGSTAATHSWTNPSLMGLLPTLSRLGSLAVGMGISQDDHDDVPNMEIRYLPKSTFVIGSGRYSNVYLGSYRKGKRSAGGGEVSGSEKWKLCAVKRLEDDEESQALGLREAWFLRHLAAVDGSSHPGSKFIIRLIGVKRESDVTNEADDLNLKQSVPQSKGPVLIGNYALEVPKLRHSRHSSLEESLQPFQPPSPLSLSKFQQSSSPSSDGLLLLLEHAPTTLSNLIHSTPHLVTRQRHTSIALQLSQAISFLHSNNILHTDIKPHNVLLSSTLDVRLADFNTAIHLPSLPHSSSLPDDPVGLGTPPYSPPEFNRPRPSPFSYPSDIWALGVTLTVALVGREPYERLSSGRRSQELKMWLMKGAYWAWEERERLNSMDDPRPLRVREGNSKIGLEQLRMLLGESDRSLEDLLSLSPSTPEAVVDSTALSISDSSPYEDGSPALHYLGTDHDIAGRVSQKIMDLLRSMCSGRPEMRPTAEEVVKLIQEEILRQGF